MATSKIKQTMNNSNTDYCKMPDGTLLCWGTIGIPESSYAPFGGMYSHDFNIDVAFPLPFIEAPNISVLNTTHSAFIPIRVDRDKNRIYEIGVMRQNSSGAANTFNYIAIGRWK